MLGDAKVIAFVPSRDLQKAKSFYEQALGLTFVSQDPFALVFNANGVMLRIADVSSVKDFKPQPFTIVGWEVASLETTVHQLAGKGIPFERFPGTPQNDLGIWKSPSGAQIAWFKDPDGNTLSVTQM
ncbi:MAG TPA: VOC family protein [Tepidisphaeraceae bacterium]|jgi:catechol 2,3-dioxygenase-like lactoylglutathione lyase family enzyme|nr:VOC family protein [Tepidisphaeraceae bacterium]